MAFTFYLSQLSDKLGLIVGTACGSVGALLVLAGVIIMCIKLKKKAAVHPDGEHDQAVQLCLNDFSAEKPVEDEASKPTQ